MTSSNFTGVQFILYHYFLYDYSITDILINYSLIILFTLINNCRSQDNRPRTLANLHTVIFFVLQILCWLLLEAYGVSLVWAGQLGLTLLLLLDWTSALYSVTVCQENKLSPTTPALRAASALMGVLAIIYYAYWFPPITTVAHIVGVVVGMLLGLAMIVMTSIQRLRNLSKLNE